MSRDQIIEKLRNYFADELGLDVSNIADEAPIFGDHLDSIEVVKVIMFIEEEFKIRLPAYEVDLETFTTFSQISHLVHGSMAVNS